MEADGTSYLNAYFIWELHDISNAQLEVLMGDNDLAGKCHIR